MRISGKYCTILLSNILTTNFLSSKDCSINNILAKPGNSCKDGISSSHKVPELRGCSKILAMGIVEMLASCGQGNLSLTEKAAVMKLRSSTIVLLRKLESLNR